MKRIGAILALFALLIVTGCGKSEQLSGTSPGQTGSVDAPPTGDQQPDPNAKGPGPSGVDLSANDPYKGVRAGAGLHDVRDGENIGYEATSIVDGSKNLGDKVDDGLASLDPALVDGRIEIFHPTGKLEMAPKLRFQNDKLFYVEYALLDTEGSMNRIVGDGVERGKWEKEKLTMLPPLGTVGKPVMFDRANIESFIDTMPRDGFMYFADGRKPWGALVRALKDPMNGYKVTEEEREAAPAGKKKKIYRLVARSTKGNKSEIELVVDGDRWVPLTFRANKQASDGQTTQLFWSSIWKFGGRHTDKDFRIPTRSR